MIYSYFLSASALAAVSLGAVVYTLHRPLIAEGRSFGGVAHDHCFLAKVEPYLATGPCHRSSAAPTASAARQGRPPARMLAARPVGVALPWEECDDWLALCGGPPNRAPHARVINHEAHGPCGGYSIC